MDVNENRAESTHRIDNYETSVDSSLPKGVYVGRVLKDRYLIERELGRGGIGAVYLARDQQLMSKPVVIKILLEELEGSIHNPWFKKKFLQEIEALARINHPGVVGVTDAGEMPDGKAFFVMQYVAGVTLRSVVEERGLPLERVANIVRQIGQALSAAHDKGIFHRDLKPENIMLEDLGEGEEMVKLIDFGIAKVKDSQVASTEVTKVAGALPYMAPEQLRAQPTASSDLYALGVIAYEMVTGHLPFYSESVVQQYEMQQAGVPVKPRELRTDLPEAAQAVILKALAFDEANRYARARDFGEALAQALMGEQSSAPLVQPLLASPAATQALRLEIAHVLFLDLVGYSKLPMDEQTQMLRQLQKIVRETTEFSRAMENNDLISLPTGDGMALVFFRDPVVPIQCALELAHALQSYPEIKLRMGVHSGPVYRIADINTNKNVSGGGINMAQRVMDCGDAGHILVSNTVAEVLCQLGNWAGHLHDLGEHEVKHGMRVHLFNLYTDDLGNPNLPEKLRAPEPQPAQPQQVKRGAKTSLVPALIVAAALLAVGVIIATIWRPAPVTQTGPASGQSATPSSAQPAAAALRRALSYSITVKPDRKPAYQVPGEMIFVAGDGVRLSIVSPQSGYLYIINEGPAPKNGRPDYNTLFPSPSANGGASLLAAGQQLQIPDPSESARGFVLDQDAGAEKVWLIWSAQSVAELEALKKWANSKDKGEIKDPAQISAVQAFLTKHSAAKPAVEKDDQQTTVKGEGEVLVHLIKLEHR